MRTMYGRIKAWARDAWPWVVCVVLAVLAALGVRKARLAVDARSRKLVRDEERREQERRSQQAIVNQAKRDAMEASAREHTAKAEQLATQVEVMERDTTVPPELRELPDDEAVKRLKRNVGLAILLTLLPMPVRADDVCVPRAVVDAANAKIERYRDVILPTVSAQVDDLRAALTDTRAALAESKAIEAEAVSQSRQDRAAGAEDRAERDQAEKSRWKWSAVSAAIALVIGGALGWEVAR